jgi:integrase
MAMALHMLTALKADKAGPGLHADGGGLYLQVQGEARSWIFRYTFGGKRRYRGLGSANALGLAEARDAAAECRKLLAQGVDPIELKREEKVKAAIEAAKAITFDECAEQYITAHEPTWRNPKHKAQWRNTLRDYASPVFGKVPVQAVDTAMVLKVLQPIWLTKNETASRVRGRVEEILDWAKARTYRTGDNPARWRGHLQHTLPKRRKVRKVVHHPAIDYAEIPAFMAELREHNGEGSRALEFLILTAARTGEVTGATPPEIDGGAWSIDGARMKGGRAHRVPLCKRAVEIVTGREGAHLFRGGRPGRPLSNAAMSAVLARLGRSDVTVHGFRATFKTWAEERTNFPRTLIEAALAHSSGDRTEEAYRRGDALEKRRKLMDAWARYCASPPAAAGGKVVSIRAAAE